MMRRVLVTGGLGFIGTNIIRYWSGRYPKDLLINLDKITYAANPSNLDDLKSKPNYRFVHGDILDDILVNSLVSEVDLIIHFAAESHVDRSIDDPSLFVRTNVLGTYNLLNAAKNSGLVRFHHISTDEVFGSIPFGSNDQFSENTPYDPSSPYSASKASSDHFVRTFGKTFGLPITISNCSNNYGPYQHPEKLIPRMISNIVSNKLVPVYGKGLNFRDWLYVIDHCRAIDLVIDKGKIGESYCIGGLTGGVTNIELVKKVLSMMGKTDEQIEFVADRPAHDNYSVSWKKINQELGWKPLETLDTGLQKTINWYQENSLWWQSSKAEAESFYQKLNQNK